MNNSQLSYDDDDRTYVKEERFSVEEAEPAEASDPSH